MGDGQDDGRRARLPRLLARRFVDADEVIVERAGMTIPQIFERDGEAGFRALEKEVCRDLAAERGMVIATGGGMLVDADNRAAMMASGLVVCLDAPRRSDPRSGLRWRRIARWRATGRRCWKSAALPMPPSRCTSIPASKTPEQIAEEISPGGDLVAAANPGKVARRDATRSSSSAGCWRRSTRRHMGWNGAARS